MVCTSHNESIVMTMATTIVAGERKSYVLIIMSPTPSINNTYFYPNNMRKIGLS